MAGALVCSLGCETNNIDGFFQEARLTPGPMLGRLVIQEEGGSRKAVARGIAMVEAMLPLAEQCRRQPVSVSHLKIGLECGGSDSFSGSSANPALGRAHRPTHQKRRHRSADGADRSFWAWKALSPAGRAPRKSPRS